MPQNQSAQVANFEVGTPVAAGVVAKFRVNRVGGEVDFTFTNDGDNTSLVSVEVSSDDSSYNATTAANNKTAVTNLSLVPKASDTVTVLLRAGIDKFVQVKGSGGTRLGIQMRRHEQAGVEEMSF
jgi:hypothetical protein